MYLKFIDFSSLIARNSSFSRCDSSGFIIQFAQRKRGEAGGVSGASRQSEETCRKPWISPFEPEAMPSFQLPTELLIPQSRLPKFFYVASFFYFPLEFRPRSSSGSVAVIIEYVRILTGAHVE